ncbi:hypothetical protein [Candidatus Methylacidithermus pantelleriae]|uniref:Uncharacterized protein n=1 Tax=Candidatus Methylacidithermus pantelleriae TaxID=2744239 RepID=A0A8J2FXE2_9BACT|nr:hypothetical protein [Candidatus Methylacidithermus pantelleriae]CAF0704897.1 hypothetical protein MPNT_80012 [Candidatus Methylacidithermus pantelleriae]
MNGHRRGLVGQVCDPQVGVILVEQRDRVIPIGFEYREAAWTAQGRSILVVGPNGMIDDMVCHLYETLVSLCARLYRKRFARNRAKKALEAIA